MLLILMYACQPKTHMEWEMQSALDTYETKRSD